jgi:hypothetical protein
VSAAASAVEASGEVVEEASLQFGSEPGHAPSGRPPEELQASSQQVPLMSKKRARIPVRMTLALQQAACALMELQARHLSLQL